MKQAIGILLAACATCFWMPAATAQCTDVTPIERSSLLQFYDDMDGEDWTVQTNWHADIPVAEWYGIRVTADGCHVDLIRLVDNNLNGELAAEYVLPYLRSLVLTNNTQLEGNIPNFWYLSNLRELDLSNNNFDGSMPNLSGMPSLKSMNLSRNQLSGVLPNLGQLPNLETLVLSENNIAGTVPNWSLPVITHLDLSSNNLIGTLPNFNHLPALQELYLSNNGLTGSLPNFSHLPALTTLALDHNELIGNLTAFNNLPALQSLDVSFNYLTGTIPVLNLPALTSLNLNHNLFNGTLPLLYNISEESNLAISIQNNRLNFNGLEQNTMQFNANQLNYTPQLPVAISTSNGKLTVNAGGTQTNNTYKWYRKIDENTWVKVAQKTGVKSYMPTESGRYICRVTNSLVPLLTLQSDEFLYGSNGKTEPPIATAAAVLNVYPSLTSGEVSVAYQGLTDGKVKLVVVDVNGKTVYTHESVSADGHYQTTLDLAHLPSGAYWVVCTAGKERQSREIVIGY